MPIAPTRRHPSEYLKSQVLVDTIIISEEGLRHLAAEVGTEPGGLWYRYALQLALQRGLDSERAVR